MPAGGASVWGSILRTTLKVVVVEFVQIVQGVGHLSDAEHGIDEGSGALHVAKIGDHLFFRLVNVL